MLMALGGCMSAARFFILSISALGLIFDVACAFFLCRRKHYKEYRFFFSYLIFRVIADVVLDLMYFANLGNYVVYYYAYWVQSALADIFAFAVLNELFCAAFKPFAGLRDMAQVVFRWAAFALLLIGVVVFCSSALPTARRVGILVVNLERSISVMQVAMLLFMYMGSSYLGLSKRSHVFGLSLGFGISAVANLVFLFVMPLLGRRPNVVLQQLPTIVSVVATFLWAAYLASPEPEREAVNVPVTSPLLRWNEVAMALGHSGGRVAFVDNPEPFMPNVERMVEEVMKRDMAGIIRR
jgi:hypothetical protein